MVDGAQQVEVQIELLFETSATVLAPLVLLLGFVAAVEAFVDEVGFGLLDTLQDGVRTAHLKPRLGLIAEENFAVLDLEAFEQLLAMFEVGEKTVEGVGVFGDRAKLARGRLGAGREIETEAIDFCALERVESVVHVDVGVVHCPADTVPSLGDVWLTQCEVAEAGFGLEDVFELLAWNVGREGLDENLVMAGGDDGLFGVQYFRLAIPREKCDVTWIRSATMLIFAVVGVGTVARWRLLLESWMS